MFDDSIEAVLICINLSGKQVARVKQVKLILETSPAVLFVFFILFGHEGRLSPDCGETCSLPKHNTDTPLCTNFPLRKLKGSLFDKGWYILHLQINLTQNNIFVILQLR